MLQPNIHLQSNPNMLQDQHLKQQHRMQQLILQQQMLQSQRQHQQQLSQQQLMSHMQSQQIQLQQQLGLQQQPNQIQLDMQPGLQASSQAPGSLLQQQNVIDQQRPLPETSSTSLDSTAQTGNSIGGDWQEEVHQKIKAMKEMYLPELNEMHQKIALKLQQSDSLLQPPKSEQLEKLKLFKTVLERVLAFLQVTKTNIQPTFREKLGSYEKQIINFINSNKVRKPIPPHQQGQLGQPLMQQPQSQVSHVQSLENQINPQTQSMSMQGSVSNMQHSSLSSLSGPSSLDSAVGPVQQNTVSAPQQGNVTNFSSQSGVNMLQPNIPLQTNPNMLMKQQEQMLHSQKQRQMQFQILMKQQLMQQQQQQQFNQKAKQQLPAQMQEHQMQQVHQMNDINELKIRQGMGVKPGVFQQHMSGGQRTPCTHQQLKSGASFPISSPQLLQAASPQLSQNSSPQIDQQNQLSSLFQSANSPSIVLSPLTMLAPSPIPGDSEEPVCGLSLVSNAGNIGQQQATVAQPAAPSFAIGTPEISRSPLLAEFVVSDVRGHGSAMGTIASGKSSVTKQPPQRLISAVKTLKELYLDELNEIHQEIASQFEQGCDASILLKSTPGKPSERDHIANNPSLRGFKILDEAKAQIEAVCPKTVSCADILAFAARDSSYKLGGFNYAVPAGRRDGRVSNVGEVEQNLPPPFFNAEQLVQNFARKGMSTDEMVTLSGAHSIGVSHCSSFSNRLYSFNATHNQDPSLDPRFAALLKSKCPNNNVNGGSDPTVALDPTPTRMDNKYYSELEKNRGLLTSDQTLMNSPSTKRMVMRNGRNGAEWGSKFAKAMVHMGSLDVLTGTQGEIRTLCTVVN